MKNTPAAPRHARRFSFTFLRRTRSIFTVFVLATLASVVACGGKSPTSATGGESKATDGKFRVALLSPGSINDDGWNALAYEGLKQMESKLGVVVGQQQVKESPGDREQGFRDFAQRGFDVVIGHGGEFMDQALAVAPEFPNTTFVVTAGDKSATNVVSVVFDTGQASYLAGAMTALLSKTGRAGAIGGQDIPASSRNLRAFRNGARAVNPKFDVAIAYIGNWHDTAAARQQALAMIDKGADILTHDCDAAAAGVFQAAKERNIRIFGMQKDQSPLAPDNVVGSAVSDIPAGLAEVVRRILQKQQKGEVVHFGIKDNAVGFTMNSKLKKGLITPDMEGRLNDLLQKIQSGEVDVFKE
jgi:basic membrane protein A and related proteins